MTVICWQDPPGQLRGPSPRRSTDNWGETAATLRTRPGVWALILEVQEAGLASNLANAIKCGRYPSFHPTLSFEAVYRMRSGVFQVYARYLGEDADRDCHAPVKDGQLHDTFPVGRAVTS